MRVRWPRNTVWMWVVAMFAIAVAWTCSGYRAVTWYGKSASGPMMEPSGGLRVSMCHGSIVFARFVMPWSRVYGYPFADSLGLKLSRLDQRHWNWAVRWDKDGEWTRQYVTTSPLRWCVVLPIWFVAIVGGAAAYGTGRAFVVTRNRVRVRRGECPRCTYPRTGLAPDAPCPECGGKLL